MDLLVTAVKEIELEVIVNVPLELMMMVLV